MKSCLLSLLLCYLSFARTISKLPVSRPRMLPRADFQRRALTTAYQHSVPNPRPGNFNFNTLRFLLAAGLFYQAFQWDRQSRYGGDVYYDDDENGDYDDGLFPSHYFQLKYLESDSRVLKSLISEFEGKTDQECAEMIKSSEISYNNRELILKLLKTRANNDGSLMDRFYEQQWSNYKNLHWDYREHFFRKVVPEVKNTIYSSAIDEVVKDLMEYDSSTREAFLTALHSCPSNTKSSIFKTDFPHISEFEEAVAACEQSNVSLEQQFAIISMRQRLEMFYQETKGFSDKPISAEEIVSMAIAASQ